MLMIAVGNAVEGDQGNVYRPGLSRRNISGFTIVLGAGNGSTGSCSSSVFDHTFEDRCGEIRGGRLLYPWLATGLSVVVVGRVVILEGRWKGVVGW